MLFAAIFGALLLQAGCGAPGTGDSGDKRPDDPPCSCVTGERRCIGSSVQVCEAESTTCSSWGALVACPSGMCENGVCKGDCQDSCPAGQSRCGGDKAREVCRVGKTGCLEWVKEDCPPLQYCDSLQVKCATVIDCGTCPSGYSCKPSGVCEGGDPLDVTLNVQTVAASGRLTLNGAAPKNGTYCNSTENPTFQKATVTFREKTFGYQFSAGMFCKDSTYAWSTPLFPGTYRVTVSGSGSDFTNLPGSGYIADDNLVVAADISNKVFDVKIVNASGRVTLNGAAPRNGAYCSKTENPTYEKATVTFREKTFGYQFSAAMFCKDTTYDFTTPLFPGTYRVTVSGAGSDFTNLPGGGFIADDNLVVLADVAGKVLDVKSFTVSGSVTLNGAAPRNGTYCNKTENPSYQKATVTFREKTFGYQFSAAMFCKDTTYGWTLPMFPGTYRVTVSGGGSDFTNLPGGGYIADDSFVVAADVAGKVFDVKSFTASGRVTQNGMAPRNGAYCSKTENPTYEKATVTFREKTFGYQFSAAMFCKDTTYDFTTPLFPGTYRVTVSGAGADFTTLPGGGYIADDSFVVAADVAGKVLDVKTAFAAGSVTLNGMAPKNGTYCNKTENPTFEKATVSFREKTFGYQFSASMLCKDTTYGWTVQLFPGTYRVTVSGAGADFTNLPGGGYIADDGFVVTADVAGKVLDVKTVAVRGRVTLNGMAPKNGAYCSGVENPTYEKATVNFRETTLGYQASAPMYCKDNTYSWSTTLFPGTYKVTVSGAGIDFTNLPGGGYVAVARLKLP